MRISTDLCCWLEFSKRKSNIKWGRHNNLQISEFVIYENITAEETAKKFARIGKVESGLQNLQKKTHFKIK